MFWHNGEKMNKELAKYIAKVAFKASADLGAIIPFIKEHCSQEEYEDIAFAIASATAGIGQDVLNLLFNKFPDIKREFDNDIKKYGRIL
jgi:hypothetical protein